MQTILAYPHSFIIRLSGSLNAANASEFQHQVTTAVQKEWRKTLLVDMEQVESLDSAGLMALVYGLRLAQALNLRFGLCAVSPSIRIIFELTQLDRVFEMFENQDAFEAALV
ncbi:MAG: STAS domain-containing protein [Chroococcidiopsidaceae cyanobacterium CP_BM_RX_35]|nr:STAS domain-containing protein [Chroococcidiopsidaceae cyanobacterium CP_BM_RX_35]